MTEAYETLAKIWSFFSTNHVACFLRGFGMFLSDSPTSVCNGGLKSKVNICVCEASTMGFSKHLQADATESPVLVLLRVCVQHWRPDDDRCVGVWAESPSIFTDVLWRSVPHERIPAWLQVERQGSGSEGGLPLWQVARRPLFLPKPNISKPLHRHAGHVPPCSTAGLMDTKPGTCDGG